MSKSPIRTLFIKTPTTGQNAVYIKVESPIINPMVVALASN